MAKRRMGRNLDALLGGAVRERSGSSARVQDAAASVAKETESSPAVAAPKKSAANEPEDSLTTERSVDVSADESGHQSGSADSLSATKQHDNSTSTSDNDAPSSVDGKHDRLVMIGVDQIRRGTYQPRRLFDQELLQELADSIKAEGMIQPIVIRPSGGSFELVAGERRWRAAQLAGLAEIPAIVRDMEDQTVAAVAVIENIQRKDLNPLEEAAAFERLCDEFGMTHKAVAESVGRSRASVTNLMRLLELHDEVKVLVDRSELEMGHARALLGAPTDKQHELAKQIIAQGLTVRAVEKLVRQLNEPEAGEGAGKKDTVVDPDIERLSQKLGETLGAAVKIQHRSSGSGKLEISYTSVGELQGILAHIK